jgi:8-oxo-dGTP pyrophosphatase MutT (NUDIX family)
VNKPNGIQCQYAALPMRYGFDKIPEVLLITSRQTGRWVIPKGWPIAKRHDYETAMIEAFEEAGLIGSVARRQPLGTYQYRKALSPKAATSLQVSVYLMPVTKQLADWPERSERTTKWFSAQHAAALVAEPTLARIIRKASFRLSRAITPTPGSFVRLLLSRKAALHPPLLDLHVV